MGENWGGFTTQVEYEKQSLPWIHRKRLPSPAAEGQKNLRIRLNIYKGSRAAKKVEFSALENQLYQ